MFPVRVGAGDGSDAMVSVGCAYDWVYFVSEQKHKGLRLTNQNDTGEKIAMFLGFSCIEDTKTFGYPLLANTESFTHSYVNTGEPGQCN